MTLTMTIREEVAVTAPAAPVFDHLADFTTTNERDPRATNSVRRSGDGGVGSEYATDVKFLGRTTQMTYTVTALEQHRRIQWTGRNRSVRACDTIDLIEQPDGSTRVTYAAEFLYRRLPPLMSALLAAPLIRLCREARGGLEDTLGQRFGPPAAWAQG